MGLFPFWSNLILFSVLSRKIGQSAVELRIRDPKLRSVEEVLVDHFGFSRASSSNAPDILIEQSDVAEKTDCSNLSLLATIENGPDVWIENQNLILTAGDAEARIRPDRRRAQISVSALPSDGQLAFHVFSVWVMALFIMLREEGLYTVHAGGVKSPANHGVLIAGSSGSGKSTLCYSLARSGWSSLSDDTIVLGRLGSSVIGYGFRTRFGLHHGSEEYFPELKHETKLQIGDLNKKAVAVETLLSTPPSVDFEPATLLFPRIVSKRESRLRLIPGSIALRELINQSTLLMLERAQAEQHLSILRDLVSQCRCYEFLGGADVLYDGGAVARLIDGSDTP